MAKTKISEFSSTPANNTDIDSINIAEGCAPSGINDAIRELMAQLKDFQTGAVGDSFNGPIGTSTAAAGAFTTLSATGAITSTLATGTAPLVIASTTKVANLNVDLLDGADWAAPAALGSTTPAAVSATTLSASSTVTLSGGTANGVAYLNGSKVVTSGSALTFDGSRFAVSASGLTEFRIADTGSATDQKNWTWQYGTGIGAGVLRLRAGNDANSDGQNAYILTRTGFNVDNHQWLASGSEQMRLTSTGLGIGTSSPAYKLEVNGQIGCADNFVFTTANPALVVNSGYLRVFTGGSERMRLDSSGNLGLGVTPSAWGSTYRAMQIGLGTSLTGITNDVDVNLTNNARFDGTNWIYIATSPAERYRQNNGTHAWFNAASGSSSTNVSFTQAMTLDADGDLVVGGTSANVYGISGKAITLNTPTGTSCVYEYTVNGTATGYFGGNASGTWVGAKTSIPIIFYTNDTERARIDSSGNLLVGTTNNGSSARIMCNGGLAVQTDGNSNRSMLVNLVSNENFNGAATAIYVGRDGTTSRSINAGGTVNASGADYAEYMTKAGNFTFDKGDVVGIDAQGKLTNVFANAVSFVVKSTDPSYVGGDTWGVGFDNDTEGLEAARQTVDRIAFAGQVPVNVLGATAGQYIVPVNDNGAIKGVAKNEADLTMSDYIKSVGKVIAIEADGRARIIVKVA